MRGNRTFNGVYSGSDVYFEYTSDPSATWEEIAIKNDFSSASGPYNAAKRFALAFDLPWPLGMQKTRRSLGRNLYEYKCRNPQKTWMQCFRVFRPDATQGSKTGSIACNRAKKYALYHGYKWPITQTSSDRSNSS